MQTLAGNGQQLRLEPGRHIDLYPTGGMKKKTTNKDTVNFNVLRFSLIIGLDLSMIRIKSIPRETAVIMYPA